MATTLPMKKPTAMELWNLHIIIVPPTQSPISITPDQNAVKPSANKQDPRTRKVIKESINDKTRIEYLQLTGENPPNMWDVQMESRPISMHDWPWTVVGRNSNNNDVPPSCNEFSWRARTKVFSQASCILWQHCFLFPPSTAGIQLLTSSWEVSSPWVKCVSYSSLCTQMQYLIKATDRLYFWNFCLPHIARVFLQVRWIQGWGHSL